MTGDASICSKESPLTKHAPSREVALILIVPENLKIVLRNDVVSGHPVDPTQSLGKQTLIRGGVASKCDLGLAAFAVAWFSREAITWYDPVRLAKGRVADTLADAEAVDAHRTLICRMWNSRFLGDQCTGRHRRQEELPSRHKAND